MGDNMTFLSSGFLFHFYLGLETTSFIQKPGYHSKQEQGNYRVNLRALTAFKQSKADWVHIHIQLRKQIFGGRRENLALVLLSLTLYVAKEPCVLATIPTAV